MHITHEMNMHNCQLCRKEWLGRCFGKKYGKDVSVDIIDIYYAGQKIFYILSC